VNLVTKLKTIPFQLGCSLLGTIAATALLSAPAQAQTASASGAVVLTRPSGGSISVSGEIVLPSGLYFAGPLNVTPAIIDPAPLTPGGNGETIANLSIDPGAALSVAALTTGTTNNPFLQAAADALIEATLDDDVAAITAIIKAGAGINGLGHLE